MLEMRCLKIVTLTAGVSITAAITVMLVWFAVPVSDFNYSYHVCIQSLLFCRLDEVYPPVENVTVTNVGPTFFTIRWNVSAKI